VNSGNKMELIRKYNGAVMIFREILNSDFEFYGDIIVKGLALSVELVWEKENRVTDFGIDNWLEIMDSRCQYNHDNKTIEVFSNDYSMGYDFVSTIAGYRNVERWDDLIKDGM